MVAISNHTNLNLSKSPYAGPTLLDLIINDRLKCALEAWEKRVRKSNNLSKFTTRALFNATEGINNEQLLRIIKAWSLKDDSDARNTRKARFLRSFGSERTKKLSTIRSWAIDFLADEQQRVQKADVVRAWAYAVIDISAIKAVNQEKQLCPSLSFEIEDLNVETVDRLTKHCLELVISTIKNGIDVETEKSEKAWGDRARRVALARFLDYSANMLISEMDEPINPIQVWKNLLKNVFPQINAYSHVDEEE